MKALVINCGPVRDGATAEIVNIVSKCLAERYEARAKKGYTVALRTGANIRECQRIFESIEHFYGHLEIECRALCSVENKDAVEQRKSEITEFCDKI